MPTLLKIGPYRFFFYSSDGCEPMHVHVERDNNIAKFWLDPIRLQNSGGFRRNEINSIQGVIQEYQVAFMEKWNEYFCD